MEPYLSIDVGESIDEAFGEFCCFVWKKAEGNGASADKSNSKQAEPTRAPGQESSSGSDSDDCNEEDLYFGVGGFMDRQRRAKAAAAAAGAAGEAAASPEKAGVSGGTEGEAAVEGGEGLAEGDDFGRSRMAQTINMFRAGEVQVRSSCRCCCCW